MLNPISFLSQCYPPKPAFTEKDLPDLSGKVYLITGASSGLGFHLASILYSYNGTIWLAARSSSKAQTAITNIRTAHPNSKGALNFLNLDLASLPSTSRAAKEFLTREKRLDVLFNNAGVMLPAPGSKTEQGYEMQMGTNCVGPFLFTKILSPILVSTAKIAPKGSVRVVWVSSSAAEGLSPAGGVPLPFSQFSGEEYERKGGMYRYGVSKAGNYLHAAEYARRFRDSGIVSIGLNPGNLNSELYRTQGAITGKFLRAFVLHEPVLGAYTELFAGLSPQVTIERSGEWVVPWGRFMKIRKDLRDASRLKVDGGIGVGEMFWEWCEEQVKSHL
ncbi:hypothetical protein BGZ60DRAFT_394871 [Tricladium varicosporioides]|nr:hypothetical protein BGZ60DRAFT_394871 [Hymenoscyphus varicosporioides]